MDIIHVGWFILINLIVFFLGIFITISCDLDVNMFVFAVGYTAWTIWSAKKFVKWEMGRNKK